MPLTAFEPDFDPALVDKVKTLVQDFGGCNDPNKAVKLSARFETQVEIMVRSFYFYCIILLLTSMDSYPGARRNSVT